MSTSPTLKPGAVIAPGAGAELPDRWALKSADRILAAFYDLMLDANARVERHYNAGELRGGGNPAAQKRYVEKLKNAFGDALLRVEVLYGKRAKFTLAFDGFEAMRAANGYDADQMWLAVARTIILKETPRRKATEDSGLIFAWSKHALVRLIQRVEVTDAVALR